MIDDEILDQWRQAELAHGQAQATGHDLLEAFIAKVAAEDAAIERFGLGPHREAYRARFPDVEAQR
jgi:phytoene/squalene synthetase